MKYKYYIFTIAIEFAIIQFSFAQELSTNPTSVKWSKMKTDHFRFIFPKGMDSIANRTINVMEANYLPVSNSLNKPPRPISIIFQNQNTVSNGFVTYTPRRSEFFITPPQDYTLLGTYNWLDQLATHEFRHVVQFEKSLTGLTKILYPFIGNYGLSGLTNIVVPSWFWEGDAVGIETAFSTSGRGAIPNFSMLMRSQLIDYDKPFSFSKANGRSYKNNIPNHYVLGYNITSYMKDKYGFDIWDKILESTYKFPFYPFSFSNNIKKVTGKSIDQVYKIVYSDLKKQVSGQIENKILYDKNYLNYSKSKYYTNYEYPQILSEGKVLALKSGLSHIAQFVILDEKLGEKKVFEIGALNDGLTLSVSNNKVVWAEFMPDPRWTMRNFSNIKTLDLETGKVQQLTKKARLAAPSISPDGRQIVAVNTSESGKYSLQMMNAESGMVFNEFDNKENVFYQHPSWSNDGKSIVVVALLNNKKTMQQIDIETGRVINLLPYSNNNYAHPILKDSLLLYNNAQNGIDNIYLLNLNNGKTYAFTNAKFGAFNGVFSENSKEIIFTDFTSLGHRVAKIPFEVSNLIEMNSDESKTVKHFGNWMLDEANKKFSNSIINHKIKSTKYSKWNIFNLSSWGFVASSTGNSLALGIDSQDLLSTTTTSIGGTYNPTERQSSYFANINYEGFYPIISLGFENEGRQTTIPKGTLKDQTVALVDNWRQQAIGLGIKLPFNFQRNKFYNKLDIGTNFSHIEGQGYDLKNRFTSQIGGSSIQSVTNYINFSRKRKIAKRDVGSRWEQSALIYSRNTPFGNNLQSNLFAVQGSLVFPGIGKHDIIRFRGNYLANGAKNSYYFSSPVAFPRGYDYSLFDKITMASIDYKIPIADPDFALGRLLYFQRIKAGFFADLGQGTYLDAKNITRKLGYNSFGVDLSTIFNVMRFLVPIEVGVRFNYTPNDKLQQFKIVPLIIDIPF